MRLLWGVKGRFAREVLWDVLLSNVVGEVGFARRGRVDR